MYAPSKSASITSKFTVLAAAATPPMRALPVPVGTSSPEDPPPPNSLPSIAAITPVKNRFSSFQVTGTPPERPVVVAASCPFVFSAGAHPQRCRVTTFERDHHNSDDTHDLGTFEAVRMDTCICCHGDRRWPDRRVRHPRRKPGAWKPCCQGYPRVRAECVAQGSPRRFIPRALSPRAALCSDTPFSRHAGSFSRIFSRGGGILNKFLSIRGGCWVIFALVRAGEQPKGAGGVCGGTCLFERA